jgi:hypothetical protein
MKNTNYTSNVMRKAVGRNSGLTRFTTAFGLSHLFCRLSKIVRITQALRSFAVVLRGRARLYGADQSNQVQYYNDQSQFNHVVGLRLDNSLLSVRQRGMNAVQVEYIRPAMYYQS